MKRKRIFRDWFWSDMADWEQRIEQFVEYLQRERRVGSSAQHQYLSIVKDWIGFSLERGRDPAAFDQAFVDTLLDRRACRNNRGALSAGSRLAYTSNLKVFCEWASADQPATPKLAYSQPPPSQQIWIESWQGRPLPSPIDALERLLQQGGTTIVRAAFKYSFFAHPDAVRRRTPWYPERARTSRKHYPGRDRGDIALWRGRSVTLGDNSYAQHAWAKYTGRPIERGSGFGVRHIWGNPWDPEAFTAGWNLCYMPFWAGMLTERQHPHPQLKAAIRQAGWNLYFCTDSVCEPPEYVNDPGVDLGRLLGTQPIYVLQG
ncbi:MAG: hypothetical protein OXI96_09420 [Acidimicrobiaceae bacterium]|nr:hypothetical protein [Acidimicrobiaceae bacterium]